MRTTVRVLLALIMLFFPVRGLCVTLVSQVLSDTPSQVSSEPSEFIHIDATISMPEKHLVPSLGTYMITLMNPRNEIDPKSFTKLKVVEMNDNTEVEESSSLITYRFEGGEWLVFDIGSISWEGLNGRKYNQLFVYRSGWFKDLPSRKLGFSDSDKAKQVALEHLQTWNIANRTVIKTYSLGMSEIEQLTTEMTKSDHGASIDVFNDPQQEDEAYFFLIGYMFNDIASVGETDSYICVNDSGVVAANIARCSNHITQIEEHVQMLTLNDALDQFVKYVSEIKQHIYVHQIAFGYYQDTNESDYTNQTLTYKPYWYVEYQMKPSAPPVSSTKNTDDFRINKAVVIDAITGKVHQVY